MLVRAAERAASLGANLEAQRAFERALELTDEPIVKAELHEQAGTMARIGGRADDATSHYEASIGFFEAADATHPASRVSARLAEVLWDRGRLEQGLENMDRAFEVLSKEQPDEDLASLAAQIGRFMFFAGDIDLSLQRIEKALELAEALSLPEVLAQALTTKAVILISRGRKNEATALLRYALDVALEHDKPSAALRAYHNLSDFLQQGDQYEAAAEARQSGLTLARRVGNRYQERNLTGQVYSFLALGRWEDVESASTDLLQEDFSNTRVAFTACFSPAVTVHVNRGRLQEARQILDLTSEFESSADLTERAGYAWARSTLQLVEGAPHEALRTAENALALREELGMSSEFVKESFVIAVQAAFELGDLAKAEGLIALAEALPPGQYPQFLRAQSSRFRARLGALRGESEAIELFKGAAGLFRELAVPFYMAVTELEHGQWLVGQARADEAEPLLAEAGEIFERLEARPWLERVTQASRGGRQSEAATAPS
jgi:tetratricopeptide (TPR) repeat protein